MPRRLSRRPGPDHPVLFTDASDIPVPIEPIRPRAAEQMRPYRSVLAAAETMALDELGHHTIGWTVRVAGERRPGDALRETDALLDDGTAVIGLTIGAAASRALRESLSARFVLVTGTVRSCEGDLQVHVDGATDLRAIAREWSARR